LVYKKMNKLFPVILAVIIGLAVGCVAGYILSPLISGQPAANILCKSSFQDGWQAAKEKLKSSGFAAMGFGNNISGAIKELAGEKIIITAPLVNPLDDEALRQRVVIVSQDTQIIVRKMRSTEEIKQLQDVSEDKIKKLQAEIEDTDDAIQKTNLQTQLISLQMSTANIFKEERIELKDLKVGYAITVEAKDSIGDKLEFEAVKVMVQEIGALDTGIIAPPAIPAAPAN